MTGAPPPAGCGDFGITSVMAAGMLAAIGAFNLIGTIGSGWLSDRFGARATIVFGWILCGHQLGAALAAHGAGFIRNAYATYMPAFHIAGILCVVAALAIFAIRTSRIRSVPATT